MDKHLKNPADFQKGNKTGSAQDSQRRNRCRGVLRRVFNPESQAIYGDQSAITFYLKVAVIRVTEPALPEHRQHGLTLCIRHGADRFEFG